VEGAEKLWQKKQRGLLAPSLRDGGRIECARRPNRREGRGSRDQWGEKKRIIAKDYLKSGKMWRSNNKQRMMKRNQNGRRRDRGKSDCIAKDGIRRKSVEGGGSRKKLDQEQAPLDLGARSGKKEEGYIKNGSSIHFSRQGLPKKRRLGEGLKGGGEPTPLTKRNVQSCWLGEYLLGESWGSPGKKSGVIGKPYHIIVTPRKRGRPLGGKGWCEEISTQKRIIGDEKR